MDTSTDVNQSPNDASPPATSAATAPTLPNFDDMPDEAKSAAPPHFDDMPDESQPTSPAPTMHSRMAAVRKTFTQGSPDKAAFGSDVTKVKPEIPSDESLLNSWEQFGIGLPEGMAGAVAGGIAGDVEGTARFLLRPYVGPGHEQTTIPTGAEGGLIGPRGLNWIDPQANPDRALGASVGDMIMPGLATKGVGALREVPKPPPGAPPEPPPPGGPNAPAPGAPPEPPSGGPPGSPNDITVRPWTGAPQPPVEPTFDPNFGVDFSAGQDTQDLGKIQTEQNALRNASGDKQHELAKQFFVDQQKPQVEGSKNVAASQFHPAGDIEASSAEEAGNVIKQELQANEITKQQAVQAQKTALAKEADRLRPTALTDPLDSASTVASSLRNTADAQTVARRSNEANLATQTENIRRSLAPDGQVIARNPQEAADVLSAGVTRAEEQATDVRDAAYDRLDALPGTYQSRAFTNVGNDIRRALNDPRDPVTLNDKTTPMAKQVIDDLDSTLGEEARTAADPNTKLFEPFTINKIGEFRKRLGGAWRQARSAANASGDYSDLRAMSRVQDAFDDIVSRATRNPNLFDGDAATVQATQNEARAAHRYLRQTFSPQGSGDTVGPKMAKIVGQRDGQAAPANQIDSWTAGNGATPVVMGRHLQQLFGPNSIEIGGIKQSMFSKAVEPVEGMNPYGPEKIADNLDKLRASELARLHFSPQELDQLRQHAINQRRSVVQPRPRTDVVGSAIDKMNGVGGQPSSPTEVANQFFGKSGNGQDPLGVKLTQHVKTTYGVNSPEFKALQDGQLSSLLRSSQGRAGFDHADVAADLREFLTGKGKHMADTLYSPEVQGRLSKYADALDAHAKRVSDFEDATKAPGPNNPVDRAVARITGSDGRPPATARDTINMLTTGKDNVALAQRLKKEMSPEKFAAVKQGLFRKMIEPGPAENRANWGPDKVVSQMAKAFNNQSELLQAVYEPHEMEVLRAYQRMQQKLGIPQSGVQWSNNAPFFHRAAQAVTYAVGAALGHMLIPFPMAREAIGAGAAHIVNKMRDAKNVRELSQQLPMVGQRMADYQQAVDTANRFYGNRAYAKRAVAVGLTLNNALRTIGVHVPMQDQRETELPRADGGATNADTDIGNLLPGSVPDETPDNSGYAGMRRSTNVVDRTQDPWYEPALEHAENNFKNVGNFARQLVPNKAGGGGSDGDTSSDPTPDPAPASDPGASATPDAPIVDPDVQAWQASVDPSIGVPRLTIGPSANQPVAKQGQQIQPVDVGKDLAAMPGTVANKVGDLTGVNDAMKAWHGDFTPEEAQTFALGAIPGALVGPEAKVAETAAEEAVPLASKVIQGIKGAGADIVKPAAEEGASALSAAGVKLKQPITGALPDTSSLANHPDRISQRIPTAKQAIEVPGDDARTVSLDAMKATPELYEHNVNLVRDYPGANIPKNYSTDKAADTFINNAADNLVWLHNKVPPDIRARSSLWYDGGNKIANDFAQKYGVTDSQAAGVIAAMSPQKDWYNNVSLAQRVLHVLKGGGDNFNKGFVFSPEMDAQYQATPSLMKYPQLYNQIKDKTLSDIDQTIPFPKDERAILKAMWVRLHDQAHADPTVYKVSPEGNTLPDASQNVAWGSLPEISKAVSIIDGDDISSTIGRRNKVRNFYNNILTPNSNAGDVTIDTHAVAAAQLRPFSGTSTEVAHNFGNSLPKDVPVDNAKNSAKTGIWGTYPLYAEAYRRAADRLGIQPRQLQSIDWEAVRGLFPENWKNAKNSAIIDNIWRQSKKVGIDETRQRVLDAAGGRIQPPTWLTDEANERIRQSARSRQPGFGSGAADAAAQNTGNAAELPGHSVYGAGTESAVPGTGSGTAREVAKEINEPATEATGTGIVGRGGVGSAPGTPEDAVATAQATAERVAQGRQKLAGLPDQPIKAAGNFVPGPVGYLHDIAEQYMHDEGLDYNPPKTYAPVDTARATKIAKAFDEMKHDPSDPRVKASYDALINETLGQYAALKQAGVKFEFIKPGMEDPYKSTPRMAAKDVVDNKHLWVYPTDTGFGSDAAARDAIKDNPLLAPTDEYIDGKRLLANDVFRIVHDMFGHFKDGNGFRAGGEENAWRSHSAMYSDEARPAMTAETRGQNSWLNYGPYGEKNRTASAADTTYAGQKIGRLPDWVSEEGRHDPGGGGMTLGSGQTSGEVAPRFFKAYHGSPYDFDKFDLSKIGTGEGAQAYGHGLYFAENPAVAADYKGKLSTLANVNNNPEAQTALYYLQQNGFDKGAARADLESRLNQKLADTHPQVQAINSYDPGKTYEVNINADPSHFLDWDKPFSEQSPHVQQAMTAAAEKAGLPLHENFASSTDDPTGANLYDFLRPTGSIADREASPDASHLLRDAGIPGIKYLDQGSRGTGTGTKNYVMFDDKLININRKYRRGGSANEKVLQRAAGGRVVAKDINHKPSGAQKAAENYKKEHVRIQGLDLTIETAKGFARSGVGKDGNAWSVKMPAHYGYLKRTEGADGDHVDVYLGPHIKSPKVFIIDQIDAGTKAYDEHKVMLGFGTKQQATNIYKSGFSDGKGKDRIGAVHEMSIDAFKEWLKFGDTTKPLSGAISTKSGKLTRKVFQYTPKASSKDQCQVCHYTSGNVSKNQGCGLYRMLNQRCEDDFDLNPNIDDEGWCSGWRARK